MKYIVYTLFFLMSSMAYGKEILLTTTNTVTIRGEINNRSMQEAKIELMKLYALRAFGKYKIYVVLDSGGGSIDAGESFIQFAKQLRDVETITIYAASMAAGIVQGLPGTRYVSEDAVMMFHRAYLSMEGQLNEGEFESRLRMVKHVVTKMEQRNANRLGISLDAYKAKVKDEYWLYGDQALADKAADEVVNIRCTNELINQTYSVEVRMLFFEGEIKLSKCPVLRLPI